jgi:hypothetical protein
LPKLLLQRGAATDTPVNAAAGSLAPHPSHLAPKPPLLARRHQSRSDVHSMRFNNPPYSFRSSSSVAVNLIVVRMYDLLHIGLGCGSWWTYSFSVRRRLRSRLRSISYADATPRHPRLHGTLTSGQIQNDKTERQTFPSLPISLPHALSASGDRFPTRS